jgi:divinyl protochlorophyllide a 8-vinyl-reductase
MNRVLSDLAHAPGRLSYRGARYLLVRPETLAALQKAVEAALGERAAACLVAGGRAGGGSALATLGAPADQAVERLLAMGGEIGWGTFALECLTGDELVVTVHDSPFARAYGPAPGPVCHLTRGVLERLAELALGAPAAARETACAAAGAAACRFEARRKSME